MFSGNSKGQRGARAVKVFVGLVKKAEENGLPFVSTVRFGSQRSTRISVKILTNIDRNCVTCGYAGIR